MNDLQIPEGFELGNLCRRGHDWEGTGHSLRYVKSRDCLCCKRLYARQWEQRNREYRQRYGQVYYLLHRERILGSRKQQRAAYATEYRERNRDQLNERNRQRRAAAKAEAAERRRIVAELRQSRLEAGGSHV